MSEDETAKDIPYEYYYFHKEQHQDDPAAKKIPQP
jgi:hypothetical protein